MSANECGARRSPYQASQPARRLPQTQFLATTQKRTPQPCSTKWCSRAAATAAGGRPASGTSSSPKRALYRASSPESLPARPRPACSTRATRAGSCVTTKKRCAKTARTPTGAISGAAAPLSSRTTASTARRCSTSTANRSPISPARRKSASASRTFRAGSARGLQSPRASSPTTSRSTYERRCTPRSAKSSASGLNTCACRTARTSNNWPTSFFSRHAHRRSRRSCAATAGPCSTAAWSTTSR